MVRGRFAVHMQTCSVSLVFEYANKNYRSIDSQRRPLYRGMNYVNVQNKLEVCTK